LALSADLTAEEDLVSPAKYQLEQRRRGESTEKILRLVTGDRGASQIIETMVVSIAEGVVYRKATVGLTSIAQIGDVTFAYLGALPTSIEDALPFSIKASGNPRLTLGHGPILSSYVDQITEMLSAAVEASLSGAPLVPVSEWSRIDRSLKEPWRFISSSQKYGDIPQVEIEWLESLNVPRQAWAPWPFNATISNEAKLQGFRHGDDDTYSLNVRFSGVSQCQAVTVRGALRPLEAPAVSRETSVSVNYAWEPNAFVGLAVVSALLGGVLGASGVYSYLGLIPQLELQDLSIGLSVVSTTVATIVAFQGNRFPERRTVPHHRSRKELYGRVASLLILTLPLLLVVFGLGSSDFRFPFSALAIVVGGYLIISSCVSVWRRKFAFSGLLRALDSDSKFSNSIKGSTMLGRSRRDPV
jgi:hypothetical protein